MAETALRLRREWRWRAETAETVPAASPSLSLHGSAAAKWSAGEERRQPAAALASLPTASSPRADAKASTGCSVWPPPHLRHGRRGGSAVVAAAANVSRAAAAAAAAAARESNGGPKAAAGAATPTGVGPGPAVASPSPTQTGG